jgi:hypothetical protein
MARDLSRDDYNEQTALHLRELEHALPLLNLFFMVSSVSCHTYIFFQTYVHDGLQIAYVADDPRHSAEPAKRFEPVQEVLLEELVHVTVVA